MVDFCDECGSILYPKKNKETGEKFLVCRSCGTERKLEGDSPSEFTLKTTIDHSLDKTLVKDDEYYDAVYGSDKTKSCPRCKGKMIMKSQQTRSADEGITHFWICVKCGKMMRIYS